MLQRISSVDADAVGVEGVQRRGDDHQWPGVDPVALW